MKMVEIEYRLQVMRSLLHNLSFDTRKKLGLLDMSLGSYGPVGMPGPKGLSREQCEMNQVELEFSLEQEATESISKLIPSLMKSITALNDDVTGKY